MKAAVLSLACFALVAAEPPTFETRKADIREMLAGHRSSAALEMAIALNREWPDDITGYQLLAEAHLQVGNYAEAEQALQWMLDLRIGKTDAAGWLLVARLREIQGDLEGAIDSINSAFTTAATGDDRTRSALFAYSGHLQFVAGRFNNAEHILSDGLKIAPTDPLTLETLAQVRIAQGRRPEAREILSQLARSTSQPRFLYQLAEAGGDTAAYDEFERAARARSKSQDNVNRELVLFYAGPGKRPREALDIARAEAIRRHDVFTLDALSVALEVNGKVAEARAVMKQILDIGVRDPQILVHAAQMGVTP